MGILYCCCTKLKVKTVKYGFVMLYLFDFHFGERFETLDSSWPWLVWELPFWHEAISTHWLSPDLCPWNLAYHKDQFLVLCYLIYVNYLLTVSQNCNIECYVDDSKLFLSFSLNELDTAVAKVNQDLKRVFEWCCVNHLLINPSLTKIMLFGVPQLLSRIPQDVTFTLMDKELEPSSTSKDLGIILDTRLSV